MAEKPVLERLKVLADAAKYDASCASSGTAKKDSRGGRGIGTQTAKALCRIVADPIGTVCEAACEELRRELATAMHDGALIVRDSEGPYQYLYKAAELPMPRFREIAKTTINAKRINTSRYFERNMDMIAHAA